MVANQYDDVRAALAGQGDFALSPAYKKKYEVSIDVWAGMSSESRKKHFNKFMKHVWYKEKNTVVASDGSQAFTGPGIAGGKKPHQRKRRRQAKTTTIAGLIRFKWHLRQIIAN